MYIWCPEDEYGNGGDCPQPERWLGIRSRCGARLVIEALGGLWLLRTSAGRLPRTPGGASRGSSSRRAIRLNGSPASTRCARRASRGTTCRRRPPGACRTIPCRRPSSVGWPSIFAARGAGSARVCWSTRSIGSSARATPSGSMPWWPMRCTTAPARPVNGTASRLSRRSRCACTCRSGPSSNSGCRPLHRVSRRSGIQNQGTVRISGMRSAAVARTLRKSLLTGPFQGA